MKNWWQLYGVGLLTLIFPTQAMAQVTPDATLGTQVIPNGQLSDVINGGTIKGNNLFHSFSEFNINAGRSVYFSNPTDVTNIFTRVTGTNPSIINGTLGVLGNANLFLMNPNGIVFGTGASLDLKGSFLGTTASSINFADGTQFSANSQSVPVLTVSVPIGLGFGSNPAPIRVEGTGHNLRFIPTPKDAFPPFTRETNPQALSVQPGRTLALVGGGISLEGGQLVAEQGRIELGSVGAGQVKINSASTRFTLSYEGVSDFRDIQLSQKSSLDASESNSSGGIYVAGRQVRLADGSVGLVQNLVSSVPGGSINVNASESLEFIGTTADGRIRSSITTETTTSGASGEIKVSTKNLAFQEGGQIVTRTFGAGDSGNVSINASDSVQVLGSSPLNPRFLSSIFVSVNGGSTGNAGDLSISTKRLTATDGAIISTASYSVGAGGDLTVNAETVELIGKDLSFGGPTDLRVGSFNNGDGGSLIVNAQRLTVRDGARVNATTIGQGNAGSVTINTSELVDVSGGTITSSATSPEIRSIINGFNTDPTGKAGSVNINTDRLVVRDKGTVAVANNGPTEAGKLQVNADSILLDNQGSLSATTRLGEGGNIFMQANSLMMRRGSSISATAGGSGNGGNITLNVGAIAQLENSDITANASQGKGGNININTQGIFRSSDSDITASSELGINGIINITSPEIKQESSLQEQPSNFIATDTIVANSCLASRNASRGSFVVTGNGGLPETPNEGTIPYIVTQVQPVSGREERQGRVNREKIQTWKLGDRITEAKQLFITPDGRIVLTAENEDGSIPNPQDLTCH
ncbi:filamentous hemagglutinin N-terminal domain-containing protein [Scytonema tolypothrichoides VB-61278_2]